MKNGGSRVMIVNRFFYSISSFEVLSMNSIGYMNLSFRSSFPQHATALFNCSITLTHSLALLSLFLFPTSLMSQQTPNKPASPSTNFQPPSAPVIIVKSSKSSSE